jgi:hypothetical protein
MLVSIVSTVKNGMLVSMGLSEKYAVPPELALLYDFVNSLDRGRHLANGVARTGGDEIETRRLLEAWMRGRRLLHRADHVDAGRAGTAEGPEKFSCETVSDTGVVEFAPGPGSNDLGSVLRQMIGLPQTGPARSAEDLRLGRVPVDIFRSLQAG